MNKTSLKKIIEHPDKDEIISKLIIGIPAKDINEWLAAKYTNAGESKFVIAEKSIKSFQENYLDIYSLIQEDLKKSKIAVSNSAEDELNLTLQNSSTYKQIMLQTANEELDIRKTIKQLCIAIETRFGQIFDEIQQDPRNINTRIDRVLIEYANVLQGILEKYYKFTEAPTDMVIQNNHIALQVVDQHILVFQDAVKEILSKMNLEQSFIFMDAFNEKISKLKAPAEKEIIPSDIRLLEAKTLNDDIFKKLNEQS